MATRILFLGLAALAIVSLMSGATVAAILFEDDFNGTSLDAGKWAASGAGTVAVSGGNVTLDVPSGDWAYSQLDSTSTWTAAGDLYYSFTIGGDPQGNYNIIQVFEGDAYNGYVAMRNDVGGGLWWFDARQGIAESPTYHGYEQPGAVSQTVSVGDIFTLKLGPTGSAAYKNGVMFDSTDVVPAGMLVIDAQCWREPGGVASQTFDRIEVSDTAPEVVNPPEPSFRIINVDFNGTRPGNPDPITYQPADGTVYNGILVDSRGGTPADDNLSISASDLLDSKGNATTVGFAVSPVGGEQAPPYVDPFDPTLLEKLNSDYLFVQANENHSDAPFTISGLGDATTINLVLSGYNTVDVSVDGAERRGNTLYGAPVVDGEVHGVIGNGDVVVVYSMTIQIPFALGDANGDGVVDDADASILGAHWLASGTEIGWEQGDFNGDQVVNDKDAAVLAAHWSQAGGEGSVPEPSITILLLAGLTVLSLRKRG